jgi:CDP-diacylglycerol--glycerol-3-phosphate 3-phosphatidyltransferase
MELKRVTLATWITISRLLAVPILLYDLQGSSLAALTVETRWRCVIVFLVAAGTDWLDGYVARNFDQVTDLGKFLDPLVDKLLILAPLVALVDLGQLPAWTVIVILTRELAIAGWRTQQPQVSGANLWGKAKTVTQMTAVTLLLAPLPLQPWHQISLVTYAVALCMTVISGLIYLWPQPNVPKTHTES